MTARNTLLVVSLLVVALSSAVHAQVPLFNATEAIENLSSSNLAQRTTAQRNLESLYLSAASPQNEKNRAEMVQSLAQHLAGKKLKPQARVFLIKLCERVGGDEVLEPLTQMLQHEQAGVRDAARRALANNPSAEATTLLIKHFESSERTPDKRAAIAAIGFRADPASTGFLTKVVNESKGPLKVAAINALSASATETLVSQSLRGIQDKDALVRFADKLVANGKKERALRVYQSLLQSNPKSPFALAALRGVFENANDESVVQQLLDTLSNGTKTMKQVATSQIRTLDASTVKALTLKFDSVNDDAKQLIVMGLGTRDDRVGRELVTKVAESAENENLKRTAIEALGGVGNGESMKVLLPLLLDEEYRDLATASILRINDSEVDLRLQGLFEATDKPESQSMILRLLMNRRSMHLPQYVWATESDSAELRYLGVLALSNLGNAEHINAILNVREKVSGKDRDEIEKRIVRMCRRIPDAVNVMSARFQKSTLVEKIDLVPVLGRVGHPSALVAIRELQAIGNAKAYDAVVSALSNWPTHEVADDLKRVVQEAEKESQRIRALRGLARVSVLGGEDSEKLTYLRFVFDNATRVDEKNLALQRAKAIRTADSLSFVLPHIEDVDLGDRAQRTVVDLAHHRGLRESNRGLFEPALRRVAKLTKDQRQLERIGKYLANE